MQREQVAEEIGCSTESLCRWYVEGKKQGLVGDQGWQGEGHVGKDTSGAAKPAAVEPAATSAPHDPGAGLGEHEVKMVYAIPSPTKPGGEPVFGAGREPSVPCFSGAGRSNP
jgi:hypothetical protein